MTPAQVVELGMFKSLNISAITAAFNENTTRENTIKY